MKKHVHSFVLISALLLASLSVGGRGESARADEPGLPGDPDFSNVTDILGGRRALFPVDDLMVTVTANNQPLVVNVAQTSGGGIGNQFDYTVLNKPQAFAAGVGRIWNLVLDVVITLTNGQMFVVARQAEGASPYSTAFALSNSGTIQQGVLAMADFTGDDFEDVAYIQNGSVYVTTAQDVGKISAGIWTSSAGIPVYPVAASDAASLAGGDLDGDGTIELILAHAWGNGVAIDVFDVQVVNPGDIKLSVVGGAYVGASAGVEEVKLVAGNFSGAVNPSTALPQYDLVVAYKYRQDANNHIVDVSSIDVTTQSTEPLAFALTVSDQNQVIDSGVEVDLVDAVSDHLNFFDPTEQVVVGVQERSGYNGYINVFTLDDQLTISHSSGLQTARGLRMMGLALGNYDQDTDRSSGPVDLEVAALMLDEIPFTSLAVPTLYVYDVDASSNFTLREYTKATVGPGKAYDVDPSFNISLSAGDYQGRSLLLGEPTKLTVQHTQPRLVLGMPPMHVDWVTDANGVGPQVLNLSAVLGGFYASYKNAENSTVSSSSQGTTSFTQAVSESVSAGYTWGNAETGSVNVNVTESAGLMHNQTVAKQHNTYQSQSFSVSAGTGFDDDVWYNDERHNIYVYPVIGQTACPADTPTPTPNCSADERVPLTVMFSGPDQIAQHVSSGGTLEWFQPVWEPGNILSYPWSLAQLEAQIPRIKLLTSSSPTEFTTDNATFDEGTTWQGGTGSSSTTGNTTNIWWGASVSVSQKPGLAGGASGSASLAYNGSRAISSLNTSTTTLGQSTGISITAPGTFANPGNYQYGIQPFIFGNNPVTGTLQNIKLGTDIQTSGILQAAFVTDLSTNPGSWWSGAYSVPDLALNHPERWNVSTAPSQFGPNCLKVTNSGPAISCAMFNMPNIEERELWNSEFFWMKGLLITPADANGEGPQITQATAGDQVRLQARVYNYSLADMPSGSQAVVQFYGQPWDTSDNTSGGDAFLIDQVELAAAAIGGYGGAQPNWAMAETIFDTTNYAGQNGQSYVFWLLVWIQDAAGNLVAEMPDHGLTSPPGTLTSITDSVDVIEDYSNNVGLHHSAFFIAPRNAELSMTAPAGEGDLTIEHVAVEPKRAVLNEKVSVSAVLRAGGQALDGVTVKFFAGDPNRGGTLFDEERITHIRPHEAAEARVPFRATTCGLHTLYIQTYPQAQTATTTLNVRIKPLPAVRELIRQTKALELPQPDRRHLLDLLHEARQLLRNRDVHGALDKLGEYRGMIEAMRGNTIPVDKADLILAQLGLISSCVNPNVHEPNLHEQQITDEEVMEDRVAGDE